MSISTGLAVVVGGGWATIAVVVGIALLRARREDVPKVVELVGDVVGRCLRVSTRPEHARLRTNANSERADR